MELDEVFDIIRKKLVAKQSELESSKKLVGELRYKLKEVQDLLNKANGRVADLEGRWAKLKEAIPSEA